MSTVNDGKYDALTKRDYSTALAMLPQSSDPAFPIPHKYEGLTKREYFAGLAMQAYCATPRDVTFERIAEWSVAQADALLEALNK
jgi:hypothetical protein